MPRDKGWGFIFRCAGFLLATIAAFCMVVHAPNIMTSLMILVSPGIWLFPHEAWGTAFQVWFLFGLLPVANGVNKYDTFLMRASQRQVGMNVESDEQAPSPLLHQFPNNSSIRNAHAGTNAGGCQ
jgi:hypothetical protein